MLGILFLSAALPVSRADDDAPVATVNGTPQEVADLQKTLRSDRLDNIEQSIARLTETVSALNERVEDLERTVDDDNGRL